jgi:hypothetical protein
VKIQINKDIIEFVAETAAESEQLEALWPRLDGGISQSRQLEPVGLYAPGEYNAAVFQIKRGSVRETSPAVPAPKDGTAYCATCRKTLPVKAGEPIPYCCGRQMKLLD